MNTFDFPNRNGAREKSRELTKVYTVPSIPVVEAAESAGVNVVFVDMGKFAEKSPVF